MNQTDYIRQAVRLRKYFFDVRPNHNIEENMKMIKPLKRNKQRKNGEVPHKNKNNGVN